MLVLGLGLIVVLMFEARDPRYYQWLTADGGPTPTTERVPSSDESAPPRYFPGVDPERLAAVRDNKPVGADEWE